METILCPECNSGNIEKNGPRNGKRRYHCKECNKYFSESTNRIPIETQVIALWLADKGKIALRMIAKILDIKSHNSIAYWLKKREYHIKFLHDDIKENIRKKANEINSRLAVLCEYNELCNQIHSMKQEMQKLDTSILYDTKYVGQLNVEIKELQRKIDDLEKQEKAEKDIDKIFKIRFKLENYRAELNVLKGMRNQCENAQPQQHTDVDESEINQKLDKLIQKANELKSKYQGTTHQSADEYMFYANQIVDALEKLLHALDD